MSAPVYDMREARVLLRKAQKDEENAMRRVRKAVIAAADAGYSKTFIARTVGVSRQTVYTILKERQ